MVLDKLHYIEYRWMLILQQQNNIKIQIINLNRMNQQQICLQPQMVQFASDNKQLIKISNKTDQTISNCFFCLFNTSKYEFSPQSFRLQPWEHKIVTVSYIAKKSQNVGKQFAYIKSKKFSKRITLSHDANFSDQKLRSPSSGVEDIYTLSSREHRETQKAAFGKIISEKQAYIKRLQRRLQQQQQSQRKDRSFTSDGKAKNYLSIQLQQLQQKLQMYIRQNQHLSLQNYELKQKIKDVQFLLLKKSSGKQVETQAEIQKIIERKQQDILKLQQDINYLEQQCQSLYSTLSQKEEKIRKIQHKNNQMISNIVKENEEKIRQLQIKIEEQKKKNDKQVKGQKQKVKKLQQKLSESEVTRNKKSDQFEQLIQKKQSELKKLQSKFEQEKKKRKQYQQDKKKALKAQIHNQSLIEQNSILKQKVQILQKSVEQLKQQTIMYKSKVDSPNKTANRYLQVALESCKNQNQLLKKSRKQLQYSLAEESRSRKIYQNKHLEYESQIRRFKEEIEELRKQKQNIMVKSRLYKDQSHQAMMKLKSENIDLIEKINCGPKVDHSLQCQLRQSKQKLQKSQNQLKKSKVESEQLFSKLKEVEQAKQKMAKKIEKYKRQTTKQLKSISQSTVDELKKLKQDKRRLSQRVVQLQKIIKDQQQKCQAHTRLDSTLQNIKNDGKTRYAASQSERRTGIKNQRRQIQQSSIKNQQIESLYTEIGELREFKNYIGIQIKKLRNLLMGGAEQNKQDQNNRLIFTCVNIFETVRSKISQQLNDRQKITETEKQLAFLKGRLTELETVAKYAKNGESISQKLSAIQLNKTNQDKGLLQLVRQQMRSQHKKLYDSLQLSQQKFQILKRKIYEQYRSRIIGMLNSREKIDNIGKIHKIQTVLQRFVDGLANKSHKQAILAKQVKLKFEARKQAGLLKDKLGHMNQLLQIKKGYCTRDPIKISSCFNEPEWHDNIKLQAKMLTYQAQNARLLQQLSLYQSKNKSYEEQMGSYQEELQFKQQQIIKLKKQVIAIESANAKEIMKRQQDIEQLQKKFIFAKDQQRQDERKNMYEKQLSTMRQEIERKKQIIKSLKQKEKMLQQLVQSSNRSEESRNKNKKQLLEDIRIQESLRQFRENNRQLRVENSRLKEEIESLKSQLEKKNISIKRMKGDGDQFRIKAAKQQTQQNEKLKSEIRHLKQQIKNNKSELQKLKKKKQKQILELESDLQRVKNEKLIQISSLQSIIRALSDNIKRLYSDLSIMAKKKGKKVNQSMDFQEILDKPAQIDSIKVYEGFQQLLQALK